MILALKSTIHRAIVQRICLASFLYCLKLTCVAESIFISSHLICPMNIALKMAFCAICFIVLSRRNLPQTE